MGLRAMKVLFKVTITVILLTLGTAVFAGSVWDGSVSTARYGYLPQTGMYAASNAFPKNTNITVTNPDTGKTVDVLVLERLEDNNLFLVLSAEAAESIGIGFGDIFYGNISRQDNTNPFSDEELPYNPDPDVNPSADSQDYSELALIQDYIDNELGGSDDTLLVSDVADPIETNSETIVTEPFKEPEEVEIIIPEETLVEAELTEELAPENIETIEEDIPSVDNMPVEEIYIGEPKDSLPVPELIVIPEPELAVEPETETEDIPELIGMSADAPILVSPADIRGVIPELPVPETDVPVFTSINTGTVEDLADETSSIELPELPIIEVEIVEEEIPLAVTMAADIVPLEESEEVSYILPKLVEPGNEKIPDAIVLVSNEPETESEIEIILEPSDLRPPVIPDETEIVEAEEIPPVVEESIITESVITDPVEVVGNFNVTKVLAEESYYLQIGVYREEYSALDLAGRLGATYPVTVLVSESRDTLNYKVMVGPLGQDESGAVLYSFKSTGYPDAFLRKGL